MRTSSYTPLHKITVFLVHIRWAQLLFHLIATATGSVLAVFTSNTPFFWNTHAIITSAFLGTLITLAWIASVMINDYHDRAIDRISNTHRPLPSGTITPETYRFLSLLLHLFIPIAALFINPIVALFLTAYLVISLAYNTPPLRLKRFPFIGTFTMGLALQMILFTGFALIAPNHIMHTYPYSWSEIFIALCIFALIAPIKDFKDVDGDRAHGILTIPVLLGPIGARLIVSSGVILLALRLVFVMHPQKNITIALFFSTACAIALIFASAYNTIITKRLLIAWLLLPITIFVLSVVTLS